MPMDDREMGERSDETLFLGRMEDIRGVVDDVLAGGPTTLLDLKRRLAGELAFGRSVDHYLQSRGAWAGYGPA